MRSGVYLTDGLCAFYLYIFKLTCNVDISNIDGRCLSGWRGTFIWLFKYGLKGRYDKIIKEAETEAEVIKKNKLLEVKEKFLNKKADLEKEVALRNQKIQQAENKLKQREMVLNQKNEELQRKRNENEAIKENLDAQLVIIDKKKKNWTRFRLRNARSWKLSRDFLPKRLRNVWWNR